MKQEPFNAHFAEANHNGEDDWEMRLIDQTDNVKDLRRKVESFWQQELKTFQPNGLNDREVALCYYLLQLPLCNFVPQYLM